MTITQCQDGLLLPDSATPDSCEIHKEDDEKAYPSYPDPRNEGGKGISEVGILLEDMAREEGRNGRTLHCCIED